MAAKLHGARVLITGIGGFTGRPLAQKLTEQGAQVFGFTLAPVQDIAAKEVLVGSLEQTADIQAVMHAADPDFIIHLAGVSFTNYDDPDLYTRINVEGTRSLLEIAADQKNVKRVILASSAAIYGDPKLGLIPEATPAAPRSDYGRSKWEMEQMSAGFAGALDILNVRPFNYTGPGQDGAFLVPKIVRHFKTRAAAIELGNLDILREFGDIRDAVHVYAALLESGAKGAVNLCSGRAYSIRDVIEICAELTGHNLDVSVNPDFVRPNDIARLIGDPARLNEITGRKATQTLRQTLESMLGE